MLLMFVTAVVMVMPDTTAAVPAVSTARLGTSRVAVSGCRRQRACNHFGGGWHGKLHATQHKALSTYRRR